MGKDCSLGDSSIGFELLVTYVDLVFAKQLDDQLNYVLLFLCFCFIPQDLPQHRTLDDIERFYEVKENEDFSPGGCPGVVQNIVNHER